MGGLFSKASPVADDNLPVVILHGLLCQHEWMDYLVLQVKAETKRNVINCQIGWDFVNTIDKTIDWQTEKLQECLKSHDETKNGFIAVGHSNGGFLFRNFIEKMNDPPVKKYISLSGPVGGFYCNKNTKCFWGNIIPDSFFTNNIYQKSFQDSVGPSGYWRDPFQISAYKTNSTCLAIINNEGNDSAEEKAARKNRFTSVDEMVYFGSPKDGLIVPWRSAWYGVFADNSDNQDEVIKMEDQDIYKNDSFGLKTMVDAGKVKFLDSGLAHLGYMTNKSFMRGALSDEIGRLGSKSAYAVVRGNLAAFIIGGCVIIALAAWLTIYAIHKRKDNKQVDVKWSDDKKDTKMEDVKNNSIWQSEVKIVV